MMVIYITVMYINFNLCSYIGHHGNFIINFCAIKLDC